MTVVVRRRATEAFSARVLCLAAMGGLLAPAPAYAQGQKVFEAMEESVDVSSRAEASSGVTSPPRQGDRAELDRIIELYMAGRYKRCSSELKQLLERDNPTAFEDTTVIEVGRLYFASCALLDDRREEARLALALAIEENPLMPSPDSLTFPPPVVSLFLEVRDEVQLLIADREKEQVIRLRRENEQARHEAERREYREQELEKLATEESIIVQNSRLVASIPFGVGQYQNDNRTLGTVVLITEGLLLVTALSSAFVLESLTSQAARKEVEIERYTDQTATAYNTMVGSTWALLGVSLLGIAEAHLNFQPERALGKRHRPLPLDLRLKPEDELTNHGGMTLRPLFGVGPVGGHVGVAGTF